MDFGLVRSLPAVETGPSTSQEQFQIYKWYQIPYRSHKIQDTNDEDANDLLWGTNGAGSDRQMSLKPGTWSCLSLYGPLQHLPDKCPSHNQLWNKVKIGLATVFKSREISGCSHGNKYQYYGLVRCDAVLSDTTKSQKTTIFSLQLAKQMKFQILQNTPKSRVSVAVTNSDESFSKCPVQILHF